MLSCWYLSSTCSDQIRIIPKFLHLINTSGRVLIGWNRSHDFPNILLHFEKLGIPLLSRRIHVSLWTVTKQYLLSLSSLICEIQQGYIIISRMVYFISQKLSFKMVCVVIWKGVPQNQFKWSKLYSKTRQKRITRRNRNAD